MQTNEKRVTGLRSAAIMKFEDWVLAWASAKGLPFGAFDASIRECGTNTALFTQRHYLTQLLESVTVRKALSARPARRVYLTGTTPAINTKNVVTNLLNKDL